MGRKSRRAIYDPSIMDRVDPSTDISPLDPDPLAFHDEHPLPEDSYETQETEILDPKLHRQYHSNTKKRKGRLLFLTTLITAGILAIVVTTAVLVSKSHSSGSGSSTGSASNPDTANGGGGGSSGSGGGGSSSGGGGGGTSNSGGTGPDRIIDPMPLDLAYTCLNAFGVFFNGTETGKGQDATLLKQCQTQCQAGECCNMPENFDFSCIKNNADTCANYKQACGILSIQASGASFDDALGDNSVTIPTPPTNLATLCDINNMITNENRASCANACGPASCCYQSGVSNCQQTNPTDCAAYLPCQNLETSAAVTDQLTSEVLHTCDIEQTITQEGRMKCNNVCKLGRCCFLGNDKCGKITTDPNFCGVQYAPCHVLYDGTLHPLPNDNYNSSAAHPGADDFLDDDNYLLDDKEQGFGNGTDDAIADDDFVDDTMANTGANPWGIQTGSNGHPVLPPVSDLQQTCDTSTIQDPTNEADCRARCKHAQCCLFDPSLPQSCLSGSGNKAKCMQYQRWCGALFGNEDQTSTTFTTSAPANLASTCSSNSLSTETGMHDCQQACQAASCCFSWEADTQCRDSSVCASYAPCLNLQAATQNSNQVQTSVDQVCTADSVKTYDGQLQCQNVCMSHMCCWAADQPFCTDDVVVSCDQYAGCKYLRQGQNFGNSVTNPAQAVLPPPDANLTDVCSAGILGDQAEKAACQSACDVAACCDLPENLEGSCLKGNHLNCLRYHRACSILQLGNTEQNTITVDPAPQDLVAWCSVESLGTEYGINKCHEECDPYDCCWNDNGTIPCRDQSNCDGYSPCMALNAGDTISTTIGTEVNATCDEQSISTPQGLAVCQQVCMQHKCCWDVYDDQVEMCFGEAACAQYTACTIALKGTGTDDANGENDGFMNDGSGTRVRRWLRQ